MGYELMVQLRRETTLLQPGDAALVNRDGEPAMVALGSAAARDVGVSAATVAAGAHTHPLAALENDGAQPLQVPKWGANGWVPSFSDVVFADRAAAEAAEVDSETATFGVMRDGLALTYRRDPDGTALVTGDGARWVPAEVPTPLHWGASVNATPADNTAAFNACAEWASMFHVPAGAYEIDGPILFRHPGTDRRLCGMQGAGARNTRLIQTAADQPMVVFNHEDPAVAYAIQPILTGLMLHIPGGADAGVPAVRHRRTITGLFRDLVLEGHTQGIVSEHSAQAWHQNIYFRVSDRASPVEAHFVFDHDPVLGQGISFGHFVSDCEAQSSGPGASRVFWLRSLDGLKVVNCHFDNYAVGVDIDMDGTGNRVKVQEVLFSNSYFDTTQSGGLPVSRTVRVRAPEGECRVEGLKFTGCMIRGVNGKAFALDEAEGALDGLDTLVSVGFTGCEFRLFEETMIDLRGASQGVVRTVLLTGNVFRPNPVSGGNPPAVAIAGRGVTLNGNSYDRGTWSSSSGRLILVDAGAEAVLIAGERCSTGRVGSENVEIESGAQHVAVGTIVSLAGAVRPRQIVSQGQDTNGWWVRYDDGWQECGRSYVATAVPITTAYGNLFRSSDLLSGSAQLNFPQPFASGVLPTIHMQARVLDYPSIEIKAGSASNAQWPSGLRVAADISMASRDVEVHLRAEGRWR